MIGVFKKFVIICMWESCKRVNKIDIRFFRCFDWVNMIVMSGVYILNFKVGLFMS